MSKAMDLQNDIPPRFCVGIDLGTTNCAAAYVDTQSSNPRIEQFLIPQRVDANTNEARSTLPSFVYFFKDEERDLSKDAFCVGYYARNRGAEQTQRQIASAKSWLCHSGVDRRAKLLPWHADSDIDQMSPVQACSHYLAHIRKVWNECFPHDPLELQDVVVTLPASFDEVARELTIAAAKQAGLTNILLIEEPQAAFYAWLANHQQSWEKKIQAGQTVLICDIGGGTTDFTLIRVKAAATSKTNADGLEQKYGLHRVAVGDHLLLGGDNLDAALAAHVEQLVSSQSQEKLSSRLWDALRANCRIAKETLLSENAPDEFTLFVAGSGRRLVDAGRTFKLQANEVQRLLLDGFFPQVSYDTKPEEITTGFREFGLPYAKDPAITKHIAEFLWSHRFAGRDPDDPTRQDDKLAARPDWILFNGGVTASKLIRERIVHQINDWYADASDWKCRELESESLDLAVSRGAAYFAMVKRGLGLCNQAGVRIDARLARAYFLTVQAEPHRVLCVMPASAQTLEHHEFTNRPVEVQLGQPVQFPLHYSSTRLNDFAGDIVDYNDEVMLNLPPIQTVLQIAKRRKASQTTAIIQSRLSEIGTLQLYLQTVAPIVDEADEINERWKLEFDLRSTVQTNLQHHQGEGERQGVLSEKVLLNAKAVLVQLFESGQIPSSKSLMQQLSEILDLPRAEWPASILRELWQTVIDLDPQYRRKSDAESRWLNLLGYFLRPGFGLAADDWRVAQTWRTVQGKIQNKNNVNEAVILWRRVAGGFTAGQQQALFQEYQAIAFKFLQGNLAGASAGYVSELIRLLATLELLDTNAKQRLLLSLLQASSKEKLKSIQPAVLWSIGRVAARQPVYGPLNCVLDAASVENLLPGLLKSDGDVAAINAMLVQIARKTGDRFRDLSASASRGVLDCLKKNQASSRQIEQVESVVQLDSAETNEMLGESLPLGISLRSL